MKIETIYEDNDILGFAKPSGLLTIPDRHNAELPNMLRQAERQYGKLFTVHRLDRETSGAIIFAKNEIAHRHYSMQFQERAAQKEYVALVLGTPTETSADIEGRIMEHPTLKGKMVINRNGRKAHSRYTLMQTWGSYSLLRVEIFTGRTHQIRIHLKSIGTPIVCDPLYGNGEPLYLSTFKRKYNQPGGWDEEKPLMARMALHAAKLTLHTLQGTQIQIVAPLPKDFNAVIKQLDKWA